MACKMAIMLAVGTLFTMHSWSYEDTTKWCSIAKTCCGTNQSPIDIPKSLTPTQGKKFKFTEYHTPPKAMQAENNGHSASFVLPNGKATIIGGGLNRQYLFAGFHFHWGNRTKGSSEHTLGGRPFDMELHFVHYGDSFSSLKDAVASKKSDALAVLGVWIKEGEENANFKPLIDALGKIKYLGDKTDVSDPPVLAKLLPDDLSKYFRYQGSLTTPECDEVVTWTMFENPVTLSKDQISAFQTLSTGKSDCKTGQLLNNCRPTQDLNGRNVLLIHV